MLCACRMQLLAQKVRDAEMWKSPQSVAYWTYHVGRCGLLTLQGIAGDTLCSAADQRSWL